MMRLVLTVIRGTRGTQDIAVRFTAQHTVADLAQAVRGGEHGTAPPPQRCTQHVAQDRAASQCTLPSPCPLGHLAPTTLLAVDSVSRSRWLLDPAISLEHSGLKSGWAVAAVCEQCEDSRTPRMVPSLGSVEVLSGSHTGMWQSLPQTPHMPHTLGRDPENRVQLCDPSVSRRHLVISSETNTLCVRDTGSANGTRLRAASAQLNDWNMLTANAPCPLSGATKLRIGEVVVRVTPAPTHQQRSQHPIEQPFVRSPVAVAELTTETRKLPAPSQATPPPRFPLIAMFGPLILGAVMFLITKSPLSLALMALSPVMLIAHWSDGKFAQRRAARRSRREFAAAVQTERDTLEKLRADEYQLREQHTPQLATLIEAALNRQPLLWSRHPKQPHFSRLRLGTGPQNSRIRLQLPPREQCATADNWQHLTQLEHSYGQLDNAPVSCALTAGTVLGITGAAMHADAALRALLLQLSVLHAPSECTIVPVVAPQARAAWQWIQWLPHTTSAPDHPDLHAQTSHTERFVAHTLASLETQISERERAREPAASTSHAREHSAVPLCVIVVITPPLQLLQQCAPLLARAAAAHTAFIWVARTPQHLPQQCSSVYEIGEHNRGQLLDIATAQVTPLSDCVGISTREATRVSRSLAALGDPHETQNAGSEQLPNAVSLSALQPTPLTQGPQALRNTWQHNRSLMRQWVPEQQQAELTYSAVIGQSAAAPQHIDLRRDGPHALVGGTTGSGKSELLQTVILSLAAQHSPDRLTFLLVDYKGGASFGLCAELPHTVGVVTDLDPHLTQRMLRSLSAELRYRESLLARHAAQDIASLEQRSHPETPPLLLVIIDEFAALVTDEPRSIERIVDLAQRGRSLGIHLILATQRPAGVVRENLRANTQLRIALRMAERSDSIDILGDARAADIDPLLPGRAVIRVGSRAPTLFHTATMGGGAQMSQDAKTGHTLGELEVRTLLLAEGERWHTSSPPHCQQHSDATQLCEDIRAAAEHTALRPLRRPWLPALPEFLPYHQLAKMQQLQQIQQPQEIPEIPHPSNTAAPANAWPFALSDDPDTQQQIVHSFVSERDGHALCIGSHGTGKTTALLTLIAAMSEHAAADPAHSYVVSAGGDLSHLVELPTVGAVVPAERLLDVQRLFELCKTHIHARQRLRAEHSAASFTELRAQLRQPHHGTPTHPHPLPKILLCIDGFAQLKQHIEARGSSDTTLDTLEYILRNGPAVGVNCIVTAHRPADVPGHLFTHFGYRAVFRLNSSYEYVGLDIDQEVLAAAPPGRMMRSGSRIELHCAVYGGDPSPSAQRRALTALAARMLAASPPLPAAPPLPVMPVPLLLDSLPSQLGQLPVCGVSVASLDPVCFPRAGVGVVAGRSGVGRSGAGEEVLSPGEAAALLLRSLQRVWRAEGVRGECVLIAGGAAHSDVHGVRWDCVAATEAEVHETLSQLLHAASDSQPEPNAGQLNPHAPQREPSPLLVVVDAIALLGDTIAQKKLCELASIVRRKPRNMLLLCLWQLPGAAYPWELLSAFKDPDWGVVIQPEPHDSCPVFSTPLPRIISEDMQRGSGIVISHGTATLTQIATAGAP